MVSSLGVRLADRRARTARVPQRCVCSRSAGRFTVSGGAGAVKRGYEPCRRARSKASRRGGRRRAPGTDETEGGAAPLWPRAVNGSRSMDELTSSPRSSRRTCCRLGSYRAWTGQGNLPGARSASALLPRCRAELLTKLYRLAGSLPGSELHLTHCGRQIGRGALCSLEARQRLWDMGLSGRGLRGTWESSGGNLRHHVVGIREGYCCRTGSGSVEMGTCPYRGEIIQCRMWFRLGAVAQGAALVKHTRRRSGPPRARQC
ncbi:hypothetical protein C8Q79DRAFT_486661 [Trametes meyenii]|nr:hypothetical protein C8Q79DRAFT_486661 [Trametes meyenii]